MRLDHIAASTLLLWILRISPHDRTLSATGRHRTQDILVALCPAPPLSYTQHVPLVSPSPTHIHHQPPPQPHSAHRHINRADIYRGCPPCRHRGGRRAICGMALSVAPCSACRPGVKPSPDQCLTCNRIHTYVPSQLHPTHTRCSIRYPRDLAVRRAAQITP